VTATDPALDLLVLGSGVAGLSAAVRAADGLGLRVGVLTKGELDQAATRWAQGGVAAVLTGDPDSTDLHLADTLAAGAGLCDVEAVRILVDEGPGRVTELIAMGAAFDRSSDGRLELAREGGHTLPRVVHAGGAATGAEIERALVEAVRRTAVAVFERWFALDLLVEDGRCSGVIALGADGVVREIRATHVLTATGGSGQVFAVTTNPLESTGDGLAMALRAGVAVADIEFVQFHPTALHHPAVPRPLLSEALRGHGALLRDAKGERFVDELLPRDAVSRAMTARMLEQDVDHLWLDATGLESFDQRFPTIAAAVRGIGLDPATDWLPIAPAAHYQCGGIVTDLDGATSLPGLWAAGEVACTGIHGANRLASNSLLEGMVFGPRVIEAIQRGESEAKPTGAMRAVIDDGVPDLIAGRVIEVPFTTPPAPTTSAASGDASTGDSRDRLQRAMTTGAGVLRSAASLTETAAIVDAVRAEHAGTVLDALAAETRNIADVAHGILAAATVRQESRGAHTRTDFPKIDEALRVRLVLR
jgi:L-aspartate oxidase